MTIQLKIDQPGRPAGVPGKNRFDLLPETAIQFKVVNPEPNTDYRWRIVEAANVVAHLAVDLDFTGPVPQPFTYADYLVACTAVRLNDLPTKTPFSMMIEVSAYPAGYLGGLPSSLNPTGYYPEGRLDYARLSFGARNERGLRLPLYSEGGDTEALYEGLTNDPDAIGWRSWIKFLQTLVLASDRSGLFNPNLILPKPSKAFPLAADRGSSPFPAMEDHVHPERLPKHFYLGHANLPTISYTLPWASAFLNGNFGYIPELQWEVVPGNPLSVSHIAPLGRYSRAVFMFTATEWVSVEINSTSSPIIPGSSGGAYTSYDTVIPIGAVYRFLQGGEAPITVTGFTPTYEAVFGKITLIAPYGTVTKGKGTYLECTKLSAGSLTINNEVIPYQDFVAQNPGLPGLETERRYNSETWLVTPGGAGGGGDGEGAGGDAGGDLAGTWPIVTVRGILGYGINTVETPLVPGKLLVFENTASGLEWVPRDVPGYGTSLLGDVTGTLGTTRLSRMLQRSVSPNQAQLGQSLRVDNSGTWVPYDPVLPGTVISGDVTGTFGAPDSLTKVTKIQGRFVADINPTNGQSLIWTGFRWEPGTPAVTLPPFAPATGDVSGTYPALSVIRLRGFPIGEEQPFNNYIFMSNGSKWLPKSPLDLAGVLPLAGDVVSDARHSIVAKIQGQWVNSAVPQVGQVLTFGIDSGIGMWIPTTPTGGSLSGDVTGPLSESRVVKLQGIAVSAAVPSIGQTLGYHPTSGWIPMNVLAPSTQFTGDVTGTFDAMQVTGLLGFPLRPTAPSLGQLLTWGEEGWEPVTLGLGGDLSGPFSDARVNRLQGRPLSSAIPSPGQALLWANSTGWTPTTLPAINNTAGGDLSGTLQNAKVIKLQGRAVRDVAPTVGQVLSWNATTGWGPSDQVTVNYNGGGDLTGVLSNAVVAKIQGRAVADVQPSTGDFLGWSGTRWEPRQPPTGTGGGEAASPGRIYTWAVDILHDIPPVTTDDLFKVALVGGTDLYVLVGIEGDLYRWRKMMLEPEVEGDTMAHVIQAWDVSSLSLISSISAADVGKVAKVGSSYYLLYSYGGVAEWKKILLEGDAGAGEQGPPGPQGPAGPAGPAGPGGAGDPVMGWLPSLDVNFTPIDGGSLTPGTHSWHGFQWTGLNYPNMEANVNFMGEYLGAGLAFGWDVATTAWAPTADNAPRIVLPLSQLPNYDLNTEIRITALIDTKVQPHDTPYGIKALLGIETDPEGTGRSLWAWQVGENQGDSTTVGSPRIELGSTTETVPLEAQAEAGVVRITIRWGTEIIFEWAPQVLPNDPEGLAYGNFDEFSSSALVEKFVWTGPFPELDGAGLRLLLGAEGTPANPIEIVVFRRLRVECFADVTNHDFDDAKTLQGREIAKDRPTLGASLQWNGSQWAPAAGAAGGVELMGFPLAEMSPSDGEVLRFSGGDGYWISGPIRLAGKVVNTGEDALEDGQTLVFSQSLDAWTPAPSSGTSLAGEAVANTTPEHNQVLMFSEDVGLRRWISKPLPMPKFGMLFDGDLRALSTTAFGEEWVAGWNNNWFVTTAGSEASGTTTGNARTVENVGLVLKPKPGTTSAFDASSHTPFSVDSPFPDFSDATDLVALATMHVSERGTWQDGEFMGIHLGHFKDSKIDATFKEHQILVQYGKLSGIEGLRVVLGTREAFVPFADLLINPADGKLSVGVHVRGSTVIVYAMGGEFPWMVDGQNPQHLVLREVKSYMTRIFMGSLPPFVAITQQPQYRMGFHAVHQDTGLDNVVFTRAGVYACDPYIVEFPPMEEA